MASGVSVPSVNFAGTRISSLGDYDRNFNSFAAITSDRFRFSTRRYVDGFDTNPTTLPQDDILTFFEHSPPVCSMLDSDQRDLENAARGMERLFEGSATARPNILTIKNHSPVRTERRPREDDPAKQPQDLKASPAFASAPREDPDYCSDDEVLAIRESQRSQQVAAGQEIRQDDIDDDAESEKGLPPKEPLPFDPHGTWAAKLLCAAPGHRDKERPGDYQTVFKGKKSSDQPRPLTKLEVEEERDWHVDCSQGGIYLMRSLKPEPVYLWEMFSSNELQKDESGEDGWKAAKDTPPKPTKEDSGDNKPRNYRSSSPSVRGIIVGMRRKYLICHLFSERNNKHVVVMHVGSVADVRLDFGPDMVETMKGTSYPAGEMTLEEFQAAVQSSPFTTETLHINNIPVQVHTIEFEGRNLRFAALRSQTEACVEIEKPYLQYSPSERDLYFARYTEFQTVKLVDTGHASTYFNRVLQTPRQAHLDCVDLQAYIGGYIPVHQGGGIYRHFFDLFSDKGLLKLPCDIPSQIKLLIHGLMGQDPYLAGGPGTGKSHAFLVHICVAFLLQPDMHKILKEIKPKADWTSKDVAILAQIRKASIEKTSGYASPKLNFIITVQNNSVADQLCLRFRDLIDTLEPTFKELRDLRDLRFLRTGKEDYLRKETSPELWRLTDYVRAHAYWQRSGGQGHAEAEKARLRLEAVKRKIRSETGYYRLQKYQSEWEEEVLKAETIYLRLKAALGMTASQVARLPRGRVIQRSKTSFETGGLKIRCRDAAAAASFALFKTTDNLILSRYDNPDSIVVLDEGFRISQIETAAVAAIPCWNRIWACSPDQNWPFNILAQLDLDKDHEYLLSRAERLHNDAKMRRSFVELTRSHRIHPDLAGHINQLFLSTISLRWTDKDKARPKPFFWGFGSKPIPDPLYPPIKKPAGPVVCIEVESRSFRSKDMSVINPSETTAALSWVYYFLDSIRKRYPQEKYPSILIISPYLGQVQDLLAESLAWLREAEHNKGNGQEAGHWPDFAKHIRIQSAYTAAGDEADVVVVVLARSHTIPGIGFLNARLISTAGTRARSSFVLVANIQHFHMSDKTAKVQALDAIRTVCIEKENSYSKPKTPADLAWMWA